MLKKIALHWQILIALILAVVMGIIFPNKYYGGEEHFNSILKHDSAAVVLTELNKEFEAEKILYSKQEFRQKIEKALPEEIVKKYESLILTASVHNPFTDKVGWMGTLFLNALKMLIVPLVLSSIISGVTSIGSASNLGRLGLKTFGYYITTSLLAIVTGLLFVNILYPGRNLNLPLPPNSKQGMNLETVGDTLLGIIPDNIFGAFSTNGMMLSVIFIAILVGFFITRLDSKNKVILSDLFKAFFELMMKITLFVIKFTPLGIFGLVVVVIADQSDLINLAQSLGTYMLAVLFALFFHAFITLPFILKFVARTKPFRHFRSMRTPLLTAFSTSSSGATLPLTMEAVEHKTGVSNKITSFTLPLGATINMDGTALYECVAAIFIAQAYGIDLTVMEQGLVVLTALLASIGAAAVPMAGLVMMTIILTAVGLPMEGVGLILAVDRILDMFRTATNVWSDSCGAVVVARSEGEKLDQ